MSRFRRLEELIAETGTQADFARRVGMNPKHVGALVSRFRDDPEGAGLDAVTIAKIMRGTNLNPLWLLYGSEPKKLDVRAGDPELATFLSRLPEGLRAVAARERLRLSEAKELIDLLDARELRPFSSGEGGFIDWTQAIAHLRTGSVRSPNAASTAAGADRARVEQGPIPKKVTLPAPPTAKPSKKRA